MHTEASTNDLDFILPVAGAAVESRTSVKLNDDLRRLQLAIRRSRSERTCHRYWSLFIRRRDDDRCVACGAGGRVAAHHVFRKSLLPEARFQTGNGATLCVECHGEAHEGFNGAADLAQPIDTQGGEKLERVAELYGILAHRYHRQHPDRSDYYHLSEQVVLKFMMMQGFDLGRPIVGEPIEKAWYIWDCSPPCVVEALVRANMPTTVGPGAKRG